MKRTRLADRPIPRVGWALLMIVLFAWFVLPTHPAVGQQAQPQGGEQVGEQALSILRRQVTDDGVTVATLNNQLTVIVAEDHTSPVVTVQAFVRAGGMLEGRWLGCGLSHLVEHLVANGATRGPGHVEAPTDTPSRLDEIGAQSNAYTTQDRTTYFINCTAGRTDEAIGILAGWLARPAITEEDFHREHGVVQRELEMGMDNAVRQMWYAHQANFYRTHPAAVPVIGYRGALAGVTYQDVLDYHRQMYTPQRTLFLVAGDVQTEAVLAKVCEALAGFESRPAGPTVLPEVPRLSGLRRVVQPNPNVKDVTETISFRTVPLVHEDLYALDVLSYVLVEGPSSRLHRLLVRDKKLALSVGGGSWTPEWGAGQLMFNLRAEPDLVDDAERELLAELKRVAAAGVGAKELLRAKRQKTADFVRGRQTIEGRASMLGGDYLSTGDVGFSRQYTERIQDVSAEQVQAAAAKYIDLDAMAITRIVPAETDLSASGRDGSARVDMAEKFELPNGLTVVLRPVDDAGLVAINLTVAGGVLAESKDTNGLGTLMMRLSTKGAAGRSAEEIAAFFDQAGGALAAECGNNTFMWRASVLAGEETEALRILADAAIRPTLSQAELDIVRPSLLSEIRSQDENWYTQLNERFRKDFFIHSPYRLLPIGSADVVEAATPQTIRRHMDSSVRAGSAVLCIYGQFDPTAMRETVASAFAGMPAGQADLVTPVQRTVAREEQHVLKTENEVAAVMIGWPGMTTMDAADRDAMHVFDTLVSGYQLPRGPLHEELRGKQLVYVVHAYNWTGLAPGAFVVYAAGQPDKADEVVGIIRRIIGESIDRAWTPEEIDQAVNIILTADLLDSQSMPELAMQAALDELYGFGYDYRSTLEQRLRAVSLDRIREVARTYLAGPAVVVVTTPAPDVLNDEATAPRQ